jgi:hypothetical protein
MTKWMNVMVMARETGSGDGGNNGDGSEPSLTSALPKSEGLLGFCAGSPCVRRPIFGSRAGQLLIFIS